MARRGREVRCQNCPGAISKHSFRFRKRIEIECARLSLDAETPFGQRKRLEFLTAVTEKIRPSRVLDIGCGTGALLTYPLALRFPDVSFVGVDSDPPSIAYAQAHYRLPNLDFRLGLEEAGRHEFDLVIASEVLEHVEDPEAFLVALKGHLNDGGHILLTVPNGYGPFELAAFAENIIRILWLFPLMRASYRVLTGRRPLFPGEDPNAMGHDTLAVTPHINFFSNRELERLFLRSGLGVVDYKSRTFICGFGFSLIVRVFHLIDWNARVADQLPPALASDWMFLLKPCKARQAPPFRRVLDARLRRLLNEKRWGLR